MIVLLIAALAGHLYYANVYMKTSQYSLYIIKQAIAERNKEVFEQHVDIPSIVSSIIDKGIAKDPKLKNNPFALAFVPFIKSMATNMVQGEINSYFNTPTTDSTTPKDPSANISTKTKKHLRIPK